MTKKELEILIERLKTKNEDLMMKNKCLETAGAGLLEKVAEESKKGYDLELRLQDSHKNYKFIERKLHKLEQTYLNLMIYNSFAGK